SHMEVCMKRRVMGFAAAMLAACGTGTEQSDDIRGDVSQNVVGDNGLTGAPEHLFYAKGGGRTGGSTLMTAHGGNVLTANKTEAIFWGAEWADPAFQGDKVSGLDSFFSGFGGSNYAKASTEYAGANGQVT